MILRAALLAALILGAAPAGAQPQSDEAFETLIRAALDIMPLLVCGPGYEGCDEATEAELASPPVTNDEAKVAFSRGIISAQAARCGLDWRTRSLAPYTDNLRASGQSRREVAILVAIHGMGQEMAADGLAECDALVRRRLDQLLAPQ